MEVLLFLIHIDHITEDKSSGIFLAWQYSLTNVLWGTFYFRLKNPAAYDSFPSEVRIWMELPHLSFDWLIALILYFLCISYVIFEDKAT